MVLQRLEKKELLSSCMDDHAKKETGRVQRYFSRTPEAIARLKEGRQVFFSLWESVGAQLDEA